MPSSTSPSSASTPLPPPSPGTGARVLACDTSSISFSPEGEATVSDPATDAALSAARTLLAAHDVVAFPTETVYGLGASALHPSAAARIFTTKGRPADNPLIVHVSSRAMLTSLLPPNFRTPATYSALMDAFWPGPLTLLFPFAPGAVPSLVTAGQPTVAVRMPAHPVARALIARTNIPLAAPSANASGKPSPTRAAHVLADLGAPSSRSGLRLILDGGPCTVGLESTVVDGLRDNGALRVLRPGGVAVEDIERVLRADARTATVRVLVHARDYRDSVLEAAPTTPGMKYRHYAPAVPVILVHTTTSTPSSSSPATSQPSIPLDTFLASLPATEPTGILAPSDSHLLTRLPHHWTHHSLGARSDAAAAARTLFDGLLALEDAGVRCIVVEARDEAREGLAFMNRVRKAAAGHEVWVEL